MPFLLRVWLSLVLAAAVAAGAAAVAQGRASRALWVWDSAPLLQDAAARQRFLEFCDARDIDVAWLQVSRSPGGNRLQYEQGWRQLLQDAHRSGVTIHALDGAPDLARRERHYVVLELVDTIIRFNRDAAPDQRFDGIHLDIEPHQLAGWSLPVIQERLLAEFLELHVRAQRAVDGEGGLEYGVDIPFWWPAPQILDVVDNVGVMDYRNVARGSDGIIAHAQGLLAYANGTRAKVFVGVETSSVAEVELPKLTFDGRTNAEMDHEIGVAHAAFLGHRSYAGFAIHHYGPYRERYP